MRSGGKHISVEAVVASAVACIGSVVDILEMCNIIGGKYYYMSV